MSIGVPIKVLHESVGHIITCETITGEVYRGEVMEAEDNMNCQIRNVTKTSREGSITNLETVFIRGSKIRFFILPDMLKNAPMVANIGKKKNRNVGKSAAIGERMKSSTNGPPSTGGRGSSMQRSNFH